MVNKFKTFLEDWRKNPDIAPDSISTSTITASASFKNGTDLDLLPACNFSTDPQKQREEVLKRIRQNPTVKLISGLSSSLAETQLSFIRSQDGFTHQLIRLTKYWYKSLTLNERVYGGSSIIEIICVASKEEIDGNNVTVLEALNRFLRNICKINSLKIAFVNDENGKWKQITNAEMKSKKYKDYFDPKIVSAENYIVEPANPYNNLGENLKPKAVDKMKEFATEMLQRIADLEVQGSNAMKIVGGTDGKITLHLPNLFQPFPIRLRDQYTHSGIPMEIFVQYDYAQYKSVHCKTEQRQAGFFKKNVEAKNAARAIQNNLLFLIRARVSRDEKNYLVYSNGLPVLKKLNDAKVAVGDLLRENFGLEKFVHLNVTAQSEHDKCQVSIFVPFFVGKTKNAIQFSMIWTA